MVGRSSSYVVAGILGATVGAGTVLLLIRPTISEAEEEGHRAGYTEARLDIARDLCELGFENPVMNPTSHPRIEAAPSVTYFTEDEFSCPRIDAELYLKEKSETELGPDSEWFLFE